MPKKIPRILIVDDDPVITAIYRKNFLDRQFVVECAACATQAVSKLPAFQPDIVLLDLNMPGRDGVELLAKLREVPKYQALPVVIVTSEPEDSPKLKAVTAAGVTGVIHKHAWGPDAVLSAVSWALEQPQRAAARRQAAGETEQSWGRRF